MARMRRHRGGVHCRGEIVQTMLPEQTSQLIDIVLASLFIFLVRGAKNSDM